MPRSKAFRALLLSLLLITTAVAGPMAGTAVAQQGGDGGEACGFDDWVAHVTSFGFVESDCMSPQEVDQEWNETDAKQTRTQIHSQASQLSAGNEQFLTVSDNLLTDTNTVAFSEGEAAAVETLATGGTVAEAQTAANESIEDYYTIKQENLVDRWDVMIETIVTQNQRANNTTGVDSDFVTVGGPGDFVTDHFDSPTTKSGSIYTGLTVTVDGSTSDTVTLLNGSTVTSTSLVASAALQDDEGGEQTGEFTYHVDGHTFTDVWVNTESSALSNYEFHKHGAHAVVDRVKVRPTDNLSSQMLVDLKEFKQQIAKIETQSQSVKEEVAVYVEDSLGPAVENGNLNATNYVSPATLSREYAQSYNGSESYVQATALAAMNGFDTPNLNKTASMTISHDGESYTGLILSQEAPSGGWQANQQYDPALLSGIQMFAVSNSGNSSGMMELDGPFSITSIEGTNGKQIEKATTVNINYQTSNASANYTEMQQEIRALNEKIEARQQSITDPGDGDEPGGNLPTSAIVVVAAVVGGALLMNGRQN